MEGKHKYGQLLQSLPEPMSAALKNLADEPKSEKHSNHWSQFGVEKNSRVLLTRVIKSSTLVLLLCSLADANSAAALAQ